MKNRMADEVAKRDALIKLTGWYEGLFSFLFQTRSLQCRWGGQPNSSTSVVGGLPLTEYIPKGVGCLSCHWIRFSGVPRYRPPLQPPLFSKQSLHVYKSLLRNKELIFTVYSLK